MAAYSMGYAVAQGVLGGVAGGADAAYKEAQEQQKSQMEAMRDAKLAQLAQETHAANVQTDIGALPQKLAAETQGAVAQQTALAPGAQAQAQALANIDVDKATRMPTTMAAGSTRFTPGTPGQPEIPQGDLDYSDTGEGRAATPGTPDQTYTAPTKLTPEQQDYYSERAEYEKQRAAYEKAQAAAVAAGDKKKPQLPDIEVKVDPTSGDTTYLDKRSGSIGVKVPGTPPTKGAFHLFQPNDPDTPAVFQHTEWTDSGGKTLPNGLADIYPDLQKSAAKAGLVGGAMGDGDGTMAPPKTPKPPAGYPDAKLAPDGSWYVKKADGYYKVKQ